MKPLTNKVVLLTGASRGIGADIATAFAAKHVRLALAARSAEELETVRKECEAAGSNTIAVPTDVGNLPSLKKLVAKVEKDFGPVDVLINNAGIEDVWDFEDQSLENMENIIRVNVTGLMWLTRLLIPSMVSRRTGHICNMASVAGLTGVPHNAVYSASKHGVVGFSRSLRAEMVDHNVEVSVVCPGFVRGGMFAQWGRKAPGVAGEVTVDQVVKAVVVAVEKNRAEVVVNKGLGKFGDVFQAMAPEFTVKTMRRTGVAGFLREQAKLNAEKAKR